MEALNSLPEEFVRLLSDSVGEDNARVATEAMGLAPSTSVRLNAAKVRDKAAFLASHFPDAEAVPWNRDGFVLSHRPSFTADPMLHAGAYYVQDSSAMFPGHVFRSLLPEGRFLKVLDLCAAPGGKTTDIAASLRSACGGEFLLVANEVMRQRASILAENVARWGDPNVVVTSADASAFATLGAWFDIILADVPCSGEGMFRKGPEALRQWSEDTVSLCEGRQRRIIADVWPSLKRGGTLVYSTCTFNRRENDGNVEWLCDNLGAKAMASSEDLPGVLSTPHGRILLPGLVPGEGQYCAAIRKEADPEEGTAVPASRRSHAARPAISDREEAYVKSLLTEPVSIRQKGDLLIAIPEAMTEAAGELDFLHPLATGTALGMFKGKDFVPSGDLALSQILRSKAFPKAEVGKDIALRFLRRDAIVLPDSEAGLVLVCNEGLPLGFVKNLGRRCNNLLPAGRRIRMELS